MHDTHTTDSAGLHRQTLTARANSSTGHEQAKKESSTVEKRQTRRAQTPRSRRALPPCRARTPRPRPWAYGGHVTPPWRRSAASAAGAYAPARFGCLSFLRPPLLRPAAEAPASSGPGVRPGDLSAPTCAASRLPAPPMGSSSSPRPCTSLHVMPKWNRLLARRSPARWPGQARERAPWSRLRMYLSL